MPRNFLLVSNDKKIHILKYILLPSIYLSVIAIISTNQNLWIISSIDHYYIELFGTILAGILAFYYIYRGRTFNDKFSLFIGIGFLVNALIDLLHVTVSLLNTDNIIFLKYFIPQTWFAGRLFKCNVTYSNDQIHLIFIYESFKYTTKTRRKTIVFKQ